LGRALGDVRVRRIGRQLLFNIPVDVANALGLKPGMTFRVKSKDNERLVLEHGEGPTRIILGGRSILRLAIDETIAPFKEGDRLLVMAGDNELILQKIDYYIVKVSKKEKSYYRVNIPWELAEMTGLIRFDKVKIRSDGNKIVIEPLDLGR